jgi:hypothetical protein
MLSKTVSTCQGYVSRQQNFYVLEMYRPHILVGKKKRIGCFPAAHVCPELVIVLVRRPMEQRDPARVEYLRVLCHRQAGQRLGHGDSTPGWWSFRSARGILPYSMC